MFLEFLDNRLINVAMFSALRTGLLYFQEMLIMYHCEYTISLVPTKFTYFNT